MNAGSKIFVVVWDFAIYRGLLGPVLVVDRYICDYHLVHLFDHHAENFRTFYKASVYEHLDTYKENQFKTLYIPIKDFNLTVGEGVRMIMDEVMERNMTESIPLMYRELPLRIYKISSKSVSRHIRPGFDQKGRRI